MNPGSPRLAAPAGSCDCHIHIYDPTAPVANPAAPPGPAGADVAGYREIQRRLGLSRAIVVQGNAYGTDNHVAEGAIAALGRETTRGVAIIDVDTDEGEMARLTADGFCGARVHMLAGGFLTWDQLEPIAAKAARFGWHVQLQLDGRILAEHEAVLARLPCPLMIDHIGKFMEPVGVEHEGFRALLRLLDNGRTWMKLSAAYEVSKAGPPLYPDTGALAAAAVRHAPERMVWATNWPHVSVKQAPDDAAQLDLLLQWAPGEATRHRILVDNPAAFYGFDPA